jgi:hypothetical protein
MAITLARASRLLDYASLAVLAGGAACYGYAWLGMRQIQNGRVTEGRAASLPTVGAWDHFLSLSQAGLVVLGVGLAMALVATVGTTTAARRARRAALAATGG